MRTRSIKIKHLAAFVVAFDCKNANRALCVAYCQSVDLAVIEPLPAEHCDKSGNTENQEDLISVSTGEFDCCPMTVSFFAAPIEKNSTLFSRVAVVTSPLPRSTGVLFRTGQRFLGDANYRGPPLRDRRELRIQHCILQI